MVAMRQALEIMRVRATRPSCVRIRTFGGRVRLSSLLLGGSLRGPYPGPAKTIISAIPDGAVTRCRHGLKLRLHQNAAFIWPYLFGEYEEANSRIYRKMIFPGATVFDVGASYGWYSVLFAKVVGRSGRVHAFEPVAEFARLAADAINLNSVDSIVELNTTGLGSVTGHFVIHTFTGLPLGHASSSDLGRLDAVPHNCLLTTLDTYVAEHQLDTIDFLKIDVEGHEREVFLGGQSILSAPRAPIIAFEINLDCLGPRDITPAQVQEPLLAFGYDHFWMINPSGGVTPVARPTDKLRTADYIAAKGKAALRVEEAAASSPTRFAKRLPELCA